MITPYVLPVFIYKQWSVCFGFDQASLNVSFDFSSYTKEQHQYQRRTTSSEITQ